VKKRKEVTMKRMWGVLGAGLIAGVVLAPLLSCNNIYGDRELLVEDPQNVVHSPHWSADGSKIYYILGKGDYSPYSRGPLWSYDLGNNTKTQITEEEISHLRGAPTKDIAVTADGWWFWIWDIETWTKVDSCQPCEDGITNWYTIGQIHFSYESENHFYYIYKPESGLLSLHRVNLEDYTDEEVLTTIGERKIFAPGPGDTLFAISDTIYNLNSGDKIPIGKTPNALQWNPAVPTELLVCTGEDNDLFLFDLEEEKTSRINTNASWGYDVEEAQFSPDGNKIAYITIDNDDASAYTQMWLLNLSD
jgi:WD40 repeat protein